MAEEHTYEHAWSCEKPSSEDHAWSYGHACDACQQEIETRHGVDYRVTDVTFEDLDRETSTWTDWDQTRHWACTHKVRARYKVEHRLTSDQYARMKIIEEKLHITYQMKNVNYGLPS